jgi:hypothetical protein
MNSGEVKVEIFDASGKLVQSIPGSKRKGINIVGWNLRMKPPKVATGGTKMDFSNLLAPMVLPGDYTLKLKAGDSVYTSRLKVVHDVSNKDFSPEDRKLQYKTAMDLYKLHEQLAAVVDTINAKQKLIKDNLDKVTDSSLKKLMRTYNDELEKIRSECLGTKQKSIFADEKKLREDITEVYVAVIRQEAAPSNLQVQRVTSLHDEVKKKEQETQQVVKKFDQIIKEGLKKEGLLPGSKKKGF